jgi:hypothetical protein
MQKPSARELNYRTNVRLSERMKARAFLGLTITIVSVYAGCLGKSEAPRLLDAGEDAPLTVAPITFRFDGTLDGSPLESGVAEFPVELPTEAAAFSARLGWSDERADLELLLLDTDGEQVDQGFAESATTRAFTTAAPLRAGNWTLRVMAERAVATTFQLEAVATFAPAGRMVIEQSYEIETRIPVRELASLQQGGFAEINLVMEPNERFNFTWTASQPVYFNVHYHDDGETQRPIEERADRLDGNFTAPIRQVFSLLWRNENPTPVTVEATVDGVFREHSRTR